MMKKRKLNKNFDSEQSFHPSVTYDYLEYNENACDILEDYSKFSLAELKFLRYYFDMRSEELPKSE